MKVAIIGAGISGLACAHEFERMGIKFDIFERRKKPGEISSYPTLYLGVIVRPIKDLIKFIDEMFDIRLTPINNLKIIKMITENRVATIRGNLGSIFLRGQDNNSVENQIFNTIKTQVNFDTHINISEIKEKYDYIIVATGNNKIAQEYGVWKSYFAPFGVKLTRIVGKFNPQEMVVWFNTNYAKTGYVYLTPFNESSASIGLIAPNTNKDELENLWSNFTVIENLSFDIVETYHLEFHVGIAEPLNIGNIYFAGNAGGFVEPFLGFGQLTAIWSGVMAARSIVNKFDYASEMQKVLSKVRYMADYRRFINTMNNKDFDRLVKLLGMPIIRNLIYNTNIDFAKYGAYFIKG